ncbi:hypothetical protein B0J13DRAFT_136537 [Dactylonectria estremocensis]|uniref:Uncharacterized protein n=1 Tax=Dactylonectria estremocensis TaxID=1079267 RepID=A0A9P9DZQ5_9HYPO|nr:hypothetical protein B0J13DRAFT_136537 [Dactylonectria estremocensis]
MVGPGSARSLGLGSFIQSSPLFCFSFSFVAASFLLLVAVSNTAAKLLKVHPHYGISRLQPHGLGSSLCAVSIGPWRSSFNALFLTPRANRRRHCQLPRARGLCFGSVPARTLRLPSVHGATAETNRAQSRTSSDTCSRRFSRCQESWRTSPD